MIKAFALLISLALVVPAATAADPAPATVGKPPAASGKLPAGHGEAQEAPADKRAAPAARKPGTLDRMQLRSTTITGNQELPKVMYVVPWKRAGAGGLGGKPFNSLVDEALQPVDRDVFGREITYFRALEQGKKGGAETPVTATKGTP